MLKLALSLGAAYVALVSAGDAACRPGSDRCSPVPPRQRYPWPQRGGNSMGNGASPHVAPSNFSRGPAWTWSNDADELFRHAPVIDDELSIYAVTSSGILRKFSHDGKPLWYWQTSYREGQVVVSPFLYEGQLFLQSVGNLPDSARENHIYSIDMLAGTVNWKVVHPFNRSVNRDSHTIHVSDGILVGAMMGERSEGNHVIYGLNASDGAGLWDYTLDGGQVWNFMPSLPGDGTFLFATSCGVAHRNDLRTGALLWRSELLQPTTPRMWCGTGGGTLGPNGVFYVEANWMENLAPGMPAREPLFGLSPCSPQGCRDGMGIMVAHRASDGAVLWKRRLGADYGGWQYPGVAEIGGRLTVVAAVGTNPAISEVYMGPAFLPEALRWWIQEAQLRSPVLRKLLGIHAAKEAVVAHDAGTGEELWRWGPEPWTRFACAGDEDRLHERLTSKPGLGKDDRVEAICGPDNWGIPTIGGDGTVYASSGKSGHLYAIRDANMDGVIDPTEVSTFAAGSAFLNGPALAPGMLVAAPCWGPIYVFKD